MTTTEPQLRPHDVRQLSLPDLDTFSVVDRLAAILGDADESTRAILSDLGHLSVHDERDGAAAATALGSLLDLLHELEVTARRVRRAIDRAELRRQAFHARIERRDAEAEQAAAEAEQRRREEAAQRQQLDDRIARAKLCAQQHGLILEKVPSFDAIGPQLWRLTTDNKGNRFLPGPFDDAAWRQVETILRGAQPIHVVPGGSGTLGRIEKWLEHHCPPFKP
ncbi:hypothetical protein MPC38_10940 [Prescottella equi]|uniref:hypothetical protein n=1 Tax=Rhodococcus hoagii TaxID=43767 RepID=UPI0019E7313A|nr:hypothetical protein [Prescottella equi]NKT12474.1 hypothetical protein [Prescottella equi]NKW49512.1 hypothetical protein [Prescottella equi]UNQ41707.1 hypothetical protein MPC38_10940 [Prescottella equi]